MTTKQGSFILSVPVSLESSLEISAAFFWVSLRSSARSASAEMVSMTPLTGFDPRLFPRRLQIWLHSALEPPSQLSKNTFPETSAITEFWL